MQLDTPKFNKKDIQAGIAHIGVGNFHRAHQAYYTNLILEDKTQQNWGICGIALLASDEKLVEKLKSQEFNYNLLVCGRHGENQAYKIKSIVEVLHNNKDAILAKLSAPEIKIISMTITEGGYNINKSTGEFDLENKDINADIENPQKPTTVFGYIAQGLRLRMENGAGAVTILSCDNLQHNGDTTKKALYTFIKAQDKELFEWAQKNLSFPNSMVDRITPVVKDEDIVKINAQIGEEDKAPIYCEDFIQWVIEDNFIAGRPNWENVGACFTKDVSAYENMKLSLLNASHTLLSYPSFLAGYRKVDEAMRDEIIVKYVCDFMNTDITPLLPVPENTDLELYKKTLIERFANRTVSDQIARLCFDGVSKIPVYIMPNLEKMLKANVDIKRLAFLIASYRRYLTKPCDDKGINFEVNEPHLSSEDKEIILKNDEVDFLNLSPFSAIDLSKYENFMSLYKSFYQRIQNESILDVLKNL